MGGGILVEPGTIYYDTLRESRFYLISLTCRRQKTALITLRGSNRDQTSILYRLLGVGTRPARKGEELDHDTTIRAAELFVRVSLEIKVMPLSSLSRSTSKRTNSSLVIDNKTAEAERMSCHDGISRQHPR